jgi:predicted DNA-binding transcriptional regulator YafY
MQCAGPTAPRELVAAFGLSRRTAIRKLNRLRAKGICEVIGSTRGTRYQLRADHSGN